MLRNLLLISGSAGMVLFEKEWVKLMDKSRMIGGLVTAIQQYSRQSTGMEVSYIEFPTVAVSMVINKRTQIICTLFHDFADGADFGHLIATQILRAFMEEFEGDDFSSVLNSSKFQGFSSKVPDIINNTSKTILNKLRSQRGIRGAVVVHEDGTTYNVGAVEDPLGLVANIQALALAGDEVMQPSGDHARLMTLEMEKQFVVVHRFEDAHLVCLCRKNVDAVAIMPHIEQSVAMLSKVNELMLNLKGAGARLL